MVDYKYSELYKQESIDKQLNIAFDGGNITNTDIHSEQFELTESLCSDAQLRFGSCEASMIKFRISNIFTPLKDKWLTVTETLNHNTDTPFKFGKYKVYSDKPSADRSYRDVVAYDAMYDIINTDVASWYNGLTFPMTLKAFRDSFFEFFGIEQQEISLVNDDMEIEKTIEPSVLSGKDVIQSICEINSCFGHIGRDDRFQYIFLKRSIEGGLFPDAELYPSDKLFPIKESLNINLYPYHTLYPSDDLYPVKNVTTDSIYPQLINVIPKSAYIHCYYEDYVTKKIDKLIIRQEENDVGCTVGNGDNAYIIEDNFLVYGKSQEELTEIATNTLAVIEDIEYRPITDSEVLGNPCLEVGDAIRFYTRYDIVDSYILNRTLKGIQGLIDSYVSDGEEYQIEKVNDVQTSITQIKGKTAGLQTQITKAEDKIELKVSKGDVSSEISVETEQIAISGNRLVVESDNFKLDAGGYAKVGGEIEATAFSSYESINLRGGLQPGWGDSSIWYKILYLDQNPNVPADPYLRSIADIDFFTSITCVGTKSRIANTENYNSRLLYCYEMPSPLFGDIGHGTIGEDGLCYVDIDSIFAETIDTIQEYYVFLTPYKTDKNMFIKEKEHGYFIVQGEPNTEFDWEIKAKQIDFPTERLEEHMLENKESKIDYEQEAINYLNEYEKELTNYGY